VADRAGRGRRAGAWIAALCGSACLLGSATSAARTLAAPAPPAARPAAGNRAPQELAFSPDGRFLYVTEGAEDCVAVVDRARRKVIARHLTGGRRPAGLAVSADGSVLVVANSHSGSLAVLDLPSGRRRALIPVPGEPWGVALSPDGSTAYVAVSQLDQVAVVDLPRETVTRRIPVGRRPRALTLPRDGLTLAVANQAGGSVSVIAPETGAEQARVRLKGVNVRGIALGAEDGEVYTTLMPAFNTKPTSDPAMVWHNLVQAVSLNGEGSSVGEDQWLDFVRQPGSLELIGAPDPSGIAVDRAARYAWFALAGRDVVTRITIHDRRRDAIWPISQIEVPVGANPRAVALSPDERELWAANHLGSSLSVIDAAAMKPLATVDLGAASRPDPTLAGQRLFHSAALTRTRRFTCASCHPDGGADGLTWSFVHVRDGFTRRNARDLRTGVAETPPFRWSGLEAHLRDFLRDEVTGLLGGPDPTEAQLADLGAAVRAFAPPPNPYRDPDDRLTAAAERGRLLFEGAAGCGACHAGSRRGGTGLKAWVGTTPPAQQVDVPHLVGVHDGAPYLHDGRAASLEEVFARFDPERRHGAASALSPGDLADLLRFLREL
jgi:YVTN family beta-propeller protein